MTAAERLGIEIIRVASRFVGLREIKSNAEWDDPTTPQRDKALSDELKAMMRPSPWDEGWAHCAAFCEGGVAQALRNLGHSKTQVDKWHSVMTPHCVTSANAFKKLGLLSLAPVPGAIGLARHGNTSKGHAWIVQTVRGVTQSTIESNTSKDSTDPAKDREGDWITNRIFGIKGRGDLYTIGFINPAEVLRLIGADVAECKCA